MKLTDLMHLDSVERLNTDIQNIQPFPHFCIDNFFNDEFADDIHASFPSYEESKVIGKEFSAVNEKYKIQVTDSGKFPPAILKLHQLLASEAFVEKIIWMTGVSNRLGRHQAFRCFQGEARRMAERAGTDAGGKILEQFEKRPAAPGEHRQIHAGPIRLFSPILPPAPQLTAPSFAGLRPLAAGAQY